MATTHGVAWGALVLRVVLGVVLVMHAYEGLVVLGPRDLASTLVRHGFPSAVVPPIVWYTIAAHAVGGALIIVGFRARAAAVLNLPVLLGALILLHVPQGFFMRGVVRDPTGRAAAVGYELSLLLLACTVTVALVGPGPFSLDSRRATPGRRR
jgi:putative oxidoreductase